MITTAILLSTVLTPQGPFPSTSILRGFPVTLSVGPGLTSLATPVRPHEILQRDAGIHEVEPRPLPLSQKPGYAFVDYADMFTEQALDPPDTNGFSFGLDWIATDSQGWSTLPAGNWAAMMFSVPTGVSSSREIIQREANLEEGAHGDVFCYFLPTSALYKNQLHRVLNSSEVNIVNMTATVPSSNTGVLDALDPVAGALQFRIPLPGLPSRPTFFCTFSKDTIGKAHSAYWQAGKVKSAASILMTTWNGTAWSFPTCFLDHNDLGLDANLDDIDAIAIDSVNKRMLFSTVKQTANHEALWVAILDEEMTAVIPNGVPYVFKTMGGSQTMSSKMGLIPGQDLDAICSIDPNTPSQSWLKYLIGIPQNTASPAVDARLQASVYRVPGTATTLDRIDSTMMGFADSNPGPGRLATLLLSVNDSPFSIVSTLARDHQAPLGDPVTAGFVLPVITSAIDIDFKVQWWEYSDPNDLGMTAVFSIRGYPAVVQPGNGG